MRILITGSNGLLGQKLLRTLTTDLHDVYGIDLAPEPFAPEFKLNYTQQNLTSRHETAETIKKIAPEVIIHAAAMTGVDQCETERELCWRTNVEATENIVNGATKVGARVVYISTDYVFDGKHGPYREEDTPNPVGYYGKSKLAGENVVRGMGDGWTVLRTIVLYGHGVGIKSSFITWLLGELRAGRPVKVVNDQWGNSTLADDLAAGIDRLLFLSKQGLYHIGGSGFMTRFEFAQRTARFFGLDENLITPVSTATFKQPAKRPLRSGLITDKAERELFIKFMDTEQALEVYRASEQTALQR
jgi:dTDP-4-dehydrorhamnose reductase